MIVGVSPDKAAAQSKFKDKFDLPFTLLADVDHKVAEAYGTWVEKSMYGRKYMGIERSTFLIGKDGKIKNDFSQGEAGRACGRGLRSAEVSVSAQKLYRSASSANELR